MAHSRRFTCWFAGAALWLGAAAPVRADPFDYVKKPDDTFSWKMKDKLELPGGTVYNLQLVSETGQGVKWEHEVQVLLAKGVKRGGNMPLSTQGGKVSVAAREVR